MSIERRQQVTSARSDRRARVRQADLSTTMRRDSDPACVLEGSAKAEKFAFGAAAPRASHRAKLKLGRRRKTPLKHPY
jgi:hypothetical protein